MASMFALSLFGCSNGTSPSSSPLPSTSVVEGTEAEKAKKNERTPVQWLQEHAISLKSTDPQSSLEDLAQLDGMIGSASVVGLGENTHGMSELFMMKHRIVQYLVTEKGFTNLVMEMDWGTILKINHYVLTGEGNPSDHLLPMFDTKEMTDMFRWIYEYNADPKHEKKVRIIGMDIQSVDEDVYDKISEYVKRNKTDLLPKLHEELTKLIPVTSDINKYVLLAKVDKEKYASSAKQIIAMLEQNKNDLFDKTEEYAWILQSARVIEQFTTIGSGKVDPDFFLKHDIAMYENAKWTQNQFGKTIVWAHNGHVSRDNILSIVYPKLSGQHLSDHYGDDYVTIGTSVHAGKYNVLNDSSDFGPYGTVKSDDPKSINYTLGQVDYDQYVVDLRKASGSVKTWLDESLPIFIGVNSIGPDRPYYLNISLGKAYDILLHIQEATPSQLNWK